MHAFRSVDNWMLWLAIAGVICFIAIYPHVSPHTAIHLTKTQHEIEFIARDAVLGLNYPIQNHYAGITFHQDKAQLQYLTHTLPLDRAKDAIKTHIPVYYWQINFRRHKSLLKAITSSKEKDSEIVFANDGTPKLPGDIQLKLSTNGDILEFNLNDKSIAGSDSISQEEALTYANGMATRLLGPSFQRFSLQSATYDSTFKFIWQSDTTLLGETLQFEMLTTGRQVLQFRKKFRLPEDYSPPQINTTFKAISGAFILLLYIIGILVVIVHRLRRDEVGISNALRLAILAGIAFVISFLTTTTERGVLEILLPVIFIPTFTIISLLAVIGSAESLARDVWPEKLLSYDAIIRRKLLNAPVARSLGYGFAGTGILLGTHVLFQKIALLMPGIYFSADDQNLSKMVVGIPIIAMMLIAFTSVCYSEFVFRIFTLSFLRRRFQHIWPIVLIASLIWMLNMMNEEILLMLPLNVHLAEKFIIGALLCLMFIRYDLLALFTTGYFFYLLKSSQAMFYWGSSIHSIYAIVPWLLTGVIGFIAILGRRRPLDEQILSEITPAHVLRMQERERIKRELEIARKVQLSFLPKSLPELSQLNIATLCLPAQEVGGDYYDFIQFNRHQLGIVIGDVSGKGISAAFHMTLTKGFLKSQARIAASPREVMIRLNELFYDNVERGTFISMIYGIFDIQEKSFTFARAGHNPIIIRSSAFDNIEDLCPKGLALGLAKTELFAGSIEEQKIGIRPGDIFLLYTDGISEAMNEHKDEFGEQRLHQILRHHGHASAEELVTIIQRQIDIFVGATPQHDDMTMLVIKIG